MSIKLVDFHDEERLELGKSYSLVELEPSVYIIPAKCAKCKINCDKYANPQRVCERLCCIVFLKKVFALCIWTGKLIDNAHNLYGVEHLLFKEECHSLGICQRKKLKIWFLYFRDQCTKCINTSKARIIKYNT
jgi:hypothetical protein